MPELLVLGGDTAAEHHVRQLTRALGPGSIRVVSSNWTEAIREWVPRAAPEDQLVPAPTMPHLLWEWLGTELGATPGPVPRGWRLPFEAPGPAGEVYLSAAAWTCPATCVEPGHCPALHAPRDWDLADLIEERALELGYTPIVFRVSHYAAGVASIPASALQAARHAAGLRLLVATSSRCHAAVGVLLRTLTG